MHITNGNDIKVFAPIDGGNAPAGTDKQKLLQIFKSHEEDYRQEYERFLRFQSVSGDPLLQKFLSFQHHPVSHTTCHNIGVSVDGDHQPVLPTKLIRLIENCWG